MIFFLLRFCIFLPLTILLKIIYIFIFGCAESSLLCELLSSCGNWGLFSSCGAHASYCCGFSSGEWALGHRLSSKGSWDSLLCSIWDLPRPAIKPLTPALAGGFFFFFFFFFRQGDSLPVSHQGSPTHYTFNFACWRVGLVKMHILMFGLSSAKEKMKLNLKDSQNLLQNIDWIFWWYCDGMLQSMGSQRVRYDFVTE